jgi:hypothetical protein
VALRRHSAGPTMSARVSADLCAHSGNAQAVAASLPARSARSWAMPELMRRRSPDAREECWHIYFGDVRVGTIGIRSGIPCDEDPWGWSCGFYPGSYPREYLYGTAPDFDQARAGFAEAWRIVSAKRSEPRRIFRPGGISAIGPQRNTGRGSAGRNCRRRCRVR